MRRMTKNVMAVMGILALGLSGVQGKEWTLSNWLKQLDAKIRRTESKRQKTTVAVAAVRGADQKQNQKLYWKNDPKSTVSPEELKGFKEALAFAQEGKTLEARAALENFMKQYPSSALGSEAKQTLELLGQEASPPPDVSTPAPQ